MFHGLLTLMAMLLAFIGLMSWCVGLYSMFRLAKLSKKFTNQILESALPFAILANKNLDDDGRKVRRTLLTSILIFILSIAVAGGLVYLRNVFLT